MSTSRLREALAQEFVKALSEDKLPWQAMWLGRRPFNAVNSRDYHGINALWLSMVAEDKGYTDPRWCTFKQAKDNGWNVKKGEKGSLVEFWSLYDKKQRKNISFSEADRIVAADSSREEDMRLVVKCYTVFNAEQIKGIPELAKQGEVDIDAVRQQRDVLLKNMGLGFHEGGGSAFYRPSEDSITMPPDEHFFDTYSYMSTFLHECGHATGHESRLNRDLTGIFGTESYAKEELRAEIASAFTSQALGFGSQGQKLESAMENHKAYIQSWIEAIKNQPNELFAAIKDAEKISDYLLEKGEFVLPEKREGLQEPLDDQIKKVTNKKRSQPDELSEELTVDRFASR